MDRLAQPFRWTTPRRVFVNSLSDLFHQDLPDLVLLNIFTIMEQCPQHTFQILTKRAELMQARVTALARQWAALGDPFPLPHVWLGVSIENRRWLSRVAALRETPAAVRFLSIEPLLEDLGPLDLRGIDWVIVGGESGPRARPLDPAWARHVRDQCQAAGVPFFFKQHGGPRPTSGGRLLDGRTWDDLPGGPHGD
jgi:protein gp37